MSERRERKHDKRRSEEGLDEPCVKIFTLGLQIRAHTWLFFSQLTLGGRRRKEM